MAKIQDLLAELEREYQGKLGKLHAHLLLTAMPAQELLDHKAIVADTEDEYAELRAALIAAWATKQVEGEDAAD